MANKIIELRKAIREIETREGHPQADPRPCCWCCGSIIKDTTMYVEGSEPSICRDCADFGGESA